jgi:hypothetical protein
LEKNDLVALSLNNLASVYVASGFIEKAVPLQESALKIWENQENPSNTNIGTALGNLAVSYIELGQFDKV